MTLLVAAWYGVLFWYGGAAPLARRENRLLLYAVGLLALTFALFANPWLRLWNTLALVLLMGIQMGGWPGMEVYPVETSAMLGERFLRVMGGLFGYLGAPVQALGSIRGLSRKKMPYVLGALLVCVPLLMVVFPLLTSADALFAQVTRRAADWFDEHLALWAPAVDFRTACRPIPVRAALLPAATGAAEAAYPARGEPFNGGLQGRSPSWQCWMSCMPSFWRCSAQRCSAALTTWPRWESAMRAMPAAVFSSLWP